MEIDEQNEQKKRQIAIMELYYEYRREGLSPKEAMKKIALIEQCFESDITA